MASWCGGGESRKGLGIPWLSNTHSSLLPYPMYSCYSKYGPPASSRGTTQELVRNAESQVPPSSTESASALKEIPRGFLCTLEFQ